MRVVKLELGADSQRCRSSARVIRFFLGWGGRVAGGGWLGAHGVFSDAVWAGIVLYIKFRYKYQFFHSRFGLTF